MRKTLSRALNPQGDEALDAINATTQHCQLMASLWAYGSRTAWATMGPNATLDA